VAVFQREGNGYGERERLSFGQQSPDVSWGRYPDGSAQMVFMPPTPGATNVTSSTGEADVQPLKMYPNPFSQQLYIHTEKVEKPYRLRLVNVFGQVVYEAGDLREEWAGLHRNGLAPGLYSVVIWDAKGRRYEGKVVAE
jgi:hypothetical protein